MYFYHKLNVVKSLFLILILAILSSQKIYSQNIYLQIKKDTIQKSNKKVFEFESANLMQNFVNDTINSLQKNGFINLNHSLTRIDSVYTLQITSNKKINFIAINYDLLPKNIDFIDKKVEIIAFYELEEHIRNTLSKLEANGYGLTEIELKDHHIISDTLYANLYAHDAEKRNFNDIVIQGYDKFPEGIKRDLKRKFNKKSFSDFHLKQVQSYLNQLTFINQIKSPEVLFEKQNTDLYIYVNKNKANKFDGFLGFGSNDEGKLKLNGYLDLALNNIINKGEKTQIVWKSDGNKQTNFKFKTEIPYLFKTPIGINFDINIFKQDSTFQNTNLNYNVGYFFNYNTRAYIGVKNNTSVYTAPTNSFYKNFEAKFYTLNFIKEFIDPQSILFKRKGSIDIKFGTGNRIAENKNNQLFLETEVDYNFSLNQKNYIYIKNATYYLKSDEYLINELYRIGGTNSLRGFNENSLQGNTLSALMVEYRYLLNQSFYINTITDFAYINDTITKLDTKAYSFGIGLGIITQNGLFKLNYANGNTSEKDFKLKNSLFHLSLNTLF